ncbi:unnamed protein product [Clonostachys rosea]|uniref:Uncharacterized protein n=1 Tax=Bionectria ochroleuca TaxID=29856 RepID=A0ABY6UL44_BIOOC|nr:unnamed protein product [Clonostachys rosea]
MVNYKQISLAGLVWLGLASQGLALGIDENTNDFTLLERADVEELYERDFDYDLYARDFDDELYERDFDDELYERDFDYDLYERDFEDAELEPRGPGDIIFGKEKTISYNPADKYQKQIDAEKAAKAARVKYAKEQLKKPVPPARKPAWKGKRGLGMGDLIFGKEKTISYNPADKYQKQIDAEKAAKAARVKYAKEQLKKPTPPAKKPAWKGKRGLGMGDMIFGKEKTISYNPADKYQKKIDAEKAAKAARVRYAKEQLKKPVPPARKPTWKGKRGMGDMIFGKEKTISYNPADKYQKQIDAEKAAKAARVNYAKEQLKKPTPPAKKPAWKP